MRTVDFLAIVSVPVAFAGTVFFGLNDEIGLAILCLISVIAVATMTIWGKK